MDRNAAPLLPTSFAFTGVNAYPDADSARGKGGYQLQAASRCIGETFEQREHAIASYERWLCDKPELMAALPELRGRDLCCWCAPLACHGDVLVRLANA